MDSVSPLRPSKAATDTSPPDSPSAGIAPAPGPKFQLLVQLADGKAETIEFTKDGCTEAFMREFVVRNRLREDLLLQPLFEHAQLMVRSNRLEDVVDVIDLL